MSATGTRSIHRQLQVKTAAGDHRRGDEGESFGRIFECGVVDRVRRFVVDEE